MIGEDLGAGNVDVPGVVEGLAHARDVLVQSGLKLSAFQEVSKVLHNR